MGYRRLLLPSLRPSTIALFWGAMGFLGLVAAELNTRGFAQETQAAAVLTVGFGEDPGSRPIGGTSASSCITCHAFEKGQTHPVNVPPSMSVPSQLPLERGMVTCNTCHESRPNHASTKETVGLRVAASGLCVQCHQVNSPTNKAVHAMAIGKAHLLPEMPGRGRSATLGFDAETKNCTGCHDGTSGMDAGSHGGRMAGLEGTGDHPMGIPLRATARTRDGDFHIARTVDKKIRLFDGKIGCGSCHSPYSKEPAQLVMSNRGSKLCLSCHVQ